MKKIIIPVSMLFLAGLSHAQTTTPSITENYVYTKTYLSDPTLANPKTSETVQYLDGLGRPKQVVNIKSTPLGNDLVTTIPYDGFGRQVDSWLPTPMSTLNGGIQSAVDGTAQTFYNDNIPFTHQNIENSPLDRVLSQVQTGTAWQTHPVNFGYSTNIDGEVKKYIATFDYPTFTSNLVTSTPYGSNQLYKNSVTDEDGNQTVEFKNGQGQTILVRKMLNATESADTYYIYNNYDQLAYVISPNASDAFKNLASGITISPTDPILTGLCYQYKYDGRNRLIEKKLPGKGWEYMVYNKADKLIMQQDANMRITSNWMFMKYDQFGRQVYSGISTTSLTRQALQSNADANSHVYESRNGTGFTANGSLIYYSNTATPVNVGKVLTINYYDTYPPYSFNPSFIPPTGATLLTDTPSTDAKSTKGLPVMSLVKNIESDNWTKNYTYYDTRGRAIGTYSINDLGGFTETKSELDFVGIPKKTTTRHKRLDTDTEKVITENFEYDNQNRLLVHRHQVNSNAEEILAQNKYNELSQLESKKIGGTNAATPLQVVDYTYNIRGWMTKINDPANLTNGKLFGYAVKYTNPETSNVPGKFNGNIAEIDWKTVTTPNDNIRRYDYKYDSLNRLLEGAYSEINPTITNNDYFTERLTYDLNGNITTLHRFAMPSSGIIANEIDNLVYNYENNGMSNKLAQITLPSGIMNNSSGYNALGNIFQYDLNGNMTSHLDKEISEIDYNFLNLPSTVIVRAGAKTETTTQYSYRADGVKIGKSYWSKIAQKTTITSYLDGFQYSIRDLQIAGTELQFVPTAEGYFDFQQNKYIYQYKDHLGSIRLSYKDGGSGAVVVEENNYYPFGLKHEGYNATVSNFAYKYNGKELQETGMYDYGARMYMPDLGRWGVVDPLAEKMTRYSPYNYAFNNPIKHIDFDGREPEDIVIRGNDKKEWRIITAGDDDVEFNVPFALKNNATLDIGAGDIDPGRFAIGYTAQGDVGAGLVIGGAGGVQMSIVQFTDKTYGGYNYVYAGAQETFSAGVQASVSASIGGSVSIAYNKSTDKIDPTTYAGITTSAGVSVGVKFIAGGGINASVFSGSGKDPGWKGVSLGLSAGVGAGVNVSGNVTLSKTWLLNDIKPTAKRNLIDRTTNMINPLGSAIITGTLDKIKQYNNKKK